MLKIWNVKRDVEEIYISEQLVFVCFCERGFACVCVEIGVAEWVESTKRSFNTEINMNSSCAPKCWHFDCDLKLKDAFNQMHNPKKKGKMRCRGILMWSWCSSSINGSLSLHERLGVNETSWFVYRRRSGRGMKVRWLWCKTQFTGKPVIIFMHIFTFTYMCVIQTLLSCTFSIVLLLLGPRLFCLMGFLWY